MTARGRLAAALAFPALALMLAMGCSSGGGPGRTEDRAGASATDDANARTSSTSGPIGHRGTTVGTPVPAPVGSDTGPGPNTTGTGPSTPIDTGATPR
jgi:hypothetical protein